ncbi:MAG: hypothetical protein ACOYK9_03070 [Chlamydiia bacterium]
MKRLFAYSWLLSLSLFSLSIKIEPYITDTNLVLEGDGLGFNGTCVGLLTGLEQKKLFEPYINGFFSISKGKLFHYDEPRAPFYQMMLEAQVGYCIPLNRRDVYRFNPFAGLGIYYQKLIEKDRTMSLYLPIGLGIDYHFGTYFTLSLISTLLPQIESRRESDTVGFFEKIPSSIGCRFELPLSLALDPYNYVSLDVIPTYQYIPLGGPAFAPVLQSKTELQQFGIRAGFHAQF